MIETTIHTRVTPQQILKALSGLPRAASGGGGTGAIVRRMLKDVGNKILEHIREAFVTKANGGTDAAGERWQPLATITVVKRMIRREKKRKRDSSPSGALTTKQRERWWNLYRQGMEIYRGNKSSAAKHAWFKIKREGVQTYFNKYKGSHAEILIDTGVLLNSLTPNPEGKGAGMQVFRIERGSVTIGTKRKGAGSHHRGNPHRNLPQRRLWPEPNKWPDEWWDDVLSTVQKGVVDITIELTK